MITNILSEDNDMTETYMLTLADKLKAMRDRKAELEDALKATNGDISVIEDALIEAMTQEECTGFKRGDRSFSLVIREFPAAIPETKDQLYTEMKSHGFEHLFTINSLTLQATLKELKANNDDSLPEWLDGLVRIAEKPSIRVTKTK